MCHRIAPADSGPDDQSLQTQSACQCGGLPAIRLSRLLAAMITIVKRKSIHSSRSTATTALPLALCLGNSCTHTLEKAASKRNSSRNSGKKEASTNSLNQIGQPPAFVQNAGCSLNHAIGMSSERTKKLITAPKTSRCSRVKDLSLSDDEFMCEKSQSNLRKVSKNSLILHFSAFYDGQCIQKRQARFSRYWHKDCLR